MKISPFRTKTKTKKIAPTSTHHKKKALRFRKAFKYQ